MKINLITFFALGGLLTGGPGWAQSAKRRLEEALSTDRYQPVGLAISRTGRMFVSFPRWTDAYQYGVVEVTKDGTRRPFPNEAWNRWKPNAPCDHFLSAQALFIDRDDFLWILDLANPNSGKTIPAGMKLLKVVLTTTQVAQIVRFEEGLPQGV